MDNIQQETQRMLNSMAQRLHALGIPKEYPYEAQLQELIKQLNQPSDVAVMGETKAGKSTFVNAYLRQELALVGDEETTATLNYFRYKNPSEPEAIKCRWRNGEIAFIKQQDVNALQGNDETTLERARRVDHIEYTLDNPILQRASFIDTPGTRSVEQVHEKNAHNVYQHDQDLSEEHDKVTRVIGSKATALIYLLKVPKEDDKGFIEKFQQDTGGSTRAFNAIGVLAKVDSTPERLRQKDELAEKYALQLKDQLNTIVPVSAALQWELLKLEKNNDAGLRHFIAMIRKIPAEQLADMLKNEMLFLPELFLDEEASCPVSFEDREYLRGAMPWGAFRCIAEVAADTSKSQEEIKQTLRDIAGFDRLHEVLDRHFFQRNGLLRAHSVLQTLRADVLHDMKYRYLPDLMRERRQEREFKRFVDWHAGESPEVAKELKAFLDRKLLQGNVQQVTQLIEEFERTLDTAILHLQQYSDDFAMLQQISQLPPGIFREEEAEELKELFGQSEQDLTKRLSSVQNRQNYVEDRQVYWRNVEKRANHALRRKVARYAATRYAYLLDQLEER